ncbi:MAG: hypothetical protein KIH69_020390 [Anaerolineae bacterium]|nr:hypothetical protein [Anaerolineae bacterium]
MIADKIDACASDKQRHVLDQVRAQAKRLDTRVCLVGGAIRDGLMGQPLGDLDFVVEGDAIQFAQALKVEFGDGLTTHEKFRTATLAWQDLSIDFTTARTERYIRPAALPIISPSNIEQDLPRRDFSINAMAWCLNDGLLLDPFGGQNDLQHRHIRALHAQSFVDDPTRAIRAARYAARFGFSIESDSLEWLKAGVPYLRDLSGERIKYDLEHIFCEAHPEIGLNLLKEWGIFAALAIPAPDASIIASRYQHARRQLADNHWNLQTLGLLPDDILRLIGWGALMYNQGQLSASRWIERIPYPAIIREALVSLGLLSSLSRQLFRAKTSQQSELLKSFSGPALFVGWLFDPDPVKRQAMRAEWHDWRWVRPATTGDDLRERGIAPGPRYAAILARLRAAWLDGEIASLQEEVELITNYELRITN